MFAFLNAYFKAFRPTSEQFPSQCVAYEKFLGRSVEPGIAFKVSDEKILKFLDIFVNFMAVNAPIKIQNLFDSTLESVATRLANVLTTGKASSDLLSDEAVLVLDAIFWKCYPKYLAFKGAKQELKMLKSLQSNKPIAAVKSEDNDFEVSSPLSIISEPMENFLDRTPPNSPQSNSGFTLYRKSKKFFKKLSFPNLDFAFRENNTKFEPASTKEGMVETLRDAEACLKFSSFVEARMAHENTLCLKAFLILESFTRSSSSRREPCYHRFLSSLALDLEDDNETVGPSFVPLFQHFYLTFLAPGSAYEINIPGSVREEITTKIKGSDIPINIFDTAVDHVLQLLYCNSYLLYMKRF